MKTVTPADLKPGAPIRITHHYKTNGPLVKAMQVYEGTVDSITEDFAIVTLREEDAFQGGKVRLVVIPSGQVESVELEAVEHRADTIVLASATTYGAAGDPNGDAIVDTGIWIKDQWSGWKMVSGDSYARVLSADIESGQVVFAIFEVIYTPPAVAE